MFSELDIIIFPDSCEVIEVVPSQLYVYTIFKCGRSSLTKSMESHGWRFVPEQDIYQIQQPITVFVRDPRDRFASGVNTFLQHLLAKDQTLDQHTMLYFVNKYLFLNRHYAPQFFWLLNLARFTGVDKSVIIRDLNDISELTDLNDDAEVLPISDEFRSAMQSFDWQKLELYFYLDQQLTDRAGQTIRISDLIADIKNNRPDLYKLVFEKTLEIANVLPKT